MLPSGDDSDRAAQPNLILFNVQTPRRLALRAPCGSRKLHRVWVFGPGKDVAIIALCRVDGPTQISIPPLVAQLENSELDPLAFRLAVIGPISIQNFKHVFNLTIRVDPPDRRNDERPGRFDYENSLLSQQSEA